MEDKGLFARKLEQLFQTFKKSDGSEYTAVEVEAGAIQLGEKITHTYVRRLREGKSRNPSYEKIKALARFFDVDPAYFFEEDMDVDEAMTETKSDSTSEFDLDSIAMRAEEIKDEAAKEVALQMLLAIKEARIRSNKEQRPGHLFVEDEG